MSRYYLVSHEYVGPDRDRRHRDLLVIQTEPARTNMGKEPRTEGWCGTTDGWSVRAHGEYESQEAARAVALARFPTYEIEEPDEYLAYSPEAVEVIGLGPYDPRSVWEADDWLASSAKEVKEALRRSPTKRTVTGLVKRYEKAAKEDGVIVEGMEKTILRLLDEVRDE